MGVKNTIIYDYMAQKILCSDVQTTNIKYTKQTTNYNTTEYEILYDKQIIDFLVPCKTGVFSFDEDNNIICGGLLYDMVEKSNGNVVTFQVFTGLKILESAPWTGDFKNVANRDFLYYMRLFRDEIRKHDSTLAQSLTDTINVQTNNPNCSFSNPEPLQKGVTVDLLAQFNDFFHSSKTVYEDGWVIKNNKIIPHVLISNRQFVRIREDVLVDETVNVESFETSYLGEYGNAILVLGGERANEKNHTDTNVTQPPYYAFYSPNTNGRVRKWLTISDERLKSNDACLKRAKYEHLQAVERFNINTVTIKNHVYCDIYSIRLLDVLKATINNVDMLIRVDSVEYDFQKDTAKISTKRVEE